MYYIGRFAVRLVMRLFFRISVCGSECIPKQGAVIICSRHISNWDPLLIGISMKRAVSFMSKEELFRFKPLGMLIKSVHGFPIQRGGNDRAAIKTALQILSQDGILVVFPEGSRNRTGDGLQPLQRGAALLASRSQASVVPVGIVGPYRLFGRVHIRFGEPFVISADTAKESGTSIAEYAKTTIESRLLAILEETLHDTANS
ncbi:MAG: lysophospholipid acyltransferase family protein [Acidibacillus sp.]|nr:lysophospholipid acyltransferase family protein [Sulfoacidibacillus ferrooxidans]MCY0894287.1 lysophospholipid acyltransferase family protein [Acidibacillus sp.]